MTQTTTKSTVTLYAAVAKVVQALANLTPEAVAYANQVQPFARKVSVDHWLQAMRAIDDYGWSIEWTEARNRITEASTYAASQAEASSSLWVYLMGLDAMAAVFLKEMGEEVPKALTAWEQVINITEAT